jgi:hypothetical protein
MTRVLDLEVLRAAPTQTEPFVHVRGRDLLRPQAAQALHADFPPIARTGFRDLGELEPRGAFADLIADLEGDELSEVLGEKFGEPYAELPRLITVRRLSAAHEGAIHRDSEKKIMSLLIYLNDAWGAPGGRLRLLNGPDSFDDYGAEIEPLTGAFVAFPRTEGSWHGHKPFVGERRAVQVAWLKDRKALEKKQRSHAFKRAVERVFGRA